MPSIVKVPRYTVYDDYDFIGFSFNGYHCIEDLGIIRVSNGTRYQENLTPQIQEQIGQHPGMDGAYFLGAQHRQKTFDIQFAFDGLTQRQVQDIQEVFSGDDIHDLWFDEYPYKVWDAKVTGQPQLQVIPFDDGNGGVLYKGEGTVQFTAYYPYAHTPDYVRWPGDKDEEEQWKNRDGRLFSSYYDVNTKQGFKNAMQWKEAANLLDSLNNTYYSEVETPLFLTISSIYDYKNGSCNGLIPELKNQLESIVIQHNGPYVINAKAFYQDKKLKQVKIINATEIGEQAFDGCTNLEEITIPSTVEFLDYNILPFDYTDIGHNRLPEYKVHMDGYWKVVSGGMVQDQYYDATELRNSYPDLGTQNAIILAQNSARRFYRMNQQEAMEIDEIID